MLRLQLSTTLFIALASVAACDSAKESRPADSGNESKAAPAAQKAEPAKAEPAKAEPAKAEPAKAEPAKAEPAKAPEPCLVTVSIDDGSAKTKPVKATSVAAMTTLDDAATSVIHEALDGKATAIAPLSRAAVLKLGRVVSESDTEVHIEFEEYDSATYNFDASGRMTKVEFDPTAETRYAIFEYHYTCDETALAAAEADDAGTTAPPEGIPADWTAVEGDPTGMEAAGTFFVPKAWVREGEPPNQTARPTADSGVHCYLSVPRELEEGSEAKAQLLKTAKADAKKHAAKDQTVEHHGVELYMLEYAAQGDGTLVIEAWSLDDAVPNGVTCADESGEKFKDVRKDVDLVVRSFIPFSGERG